LKYKKKIVVMLMGILIFIFAGCSAGKKPSVSGKDYYYPKTETEKQSEMQEAPIKAEFGAEHYMIISNNMAKEYMLVRQLESGKESLVTYSLTTSFFDKYGSSTSVSSFESGQIITLGQKDLDGRLKSICLADGVWEYENVVRYEIEEERGVFEIADTKYYFDEGLRVFSDGERVKLSDIKEDELRIVGMNKQILSVVVTTGHGMIALKNTELFEDSFIQIGRDIFAEITGEMEFEVPEGSYIVSVANKGYGGSKEYEVKRDEVTEIDLDELKGEGPKMCSIVFEIGTSDENTDAEITFRIDGETADYDAPIDLAYGIHSIKAESEGYETYAKKLYVNSETAVISIVLEEAGTDNERNEEETPDDDNTDDDDTNGENTDDEGADDGENNADNTNHAGSLAGSLAGSAGNSNTNENTNTNNNTNTDALIEALTEALGGDNSTDYLSTLSQLLGNVLN